MKLQTKVLLLLSLFFGIFFLSFLSYQYIRIREKKLIYLENSKNQELVIDKVLQLNRAKYEQLINDNSSWDEMVSFASHPDTVWAKDNVDFFVNSFHLSFVLVYNKEIKPIYQFGEKSILKQMVIPDQKMIQRAFADTVFTHYFEYCGDELMEIFGATIVPASDSEARITPALGYLFIGRIWNRKYLFEHEQTSNYKVDILKKPDLPNFKKDDHRVYLIRNLKNNSGETIAVLLFSTNNSLKEDMSVFLYLSILVTIIALTSLVIFLFYFRKIILVPITKISNTLNTRNPEHLIFFNNNTDEFKKLADLILQYFRQEELLKKSNIELSENIATKDKLFSIIAHDLKNPIGNILSLSDLLNKSMKIGDMETTYELFELIGSQAKESLVLLETLFDWAKTQTGNLNFVPENLLLIKTVEQVIEILTPAASLKDISIKLQIPQDLYLSADVNMLQTILRNLVANAVKFTNQGGTIQIIAKAGSDSTKITIADNGIGMSKEIQDKLFKINTNLTTVGTANEKGTGLGLIICKEFVEKHGGEIYVESIPEQGSRFIFTIPNASVKPETV